MRAAKEVTFKRIRIFSVALITAIVALAIGAGFFYMEKYVDKVSPIARSTGPLEFPEDDLPDWFNEELASLIQTTAGGKIFDLNESSAKTVAEKLSQLKWFEQLKVQTTKDSLRVSAKYRKPVASIKVGSRKYCIDRELAAMRYLNIANLPIVEITNSTLRSIENVNVQEDVKEAVKLIKLLSFMDKGIEPVPPLLKEIAKIDVGNFNGRASRSRSQSHITLYARDATPIHWGNELEKTTGEIEATDKEKLSSLYRTYMDGGKNTLLDRGVKYIDLRNPRRY